MRTKWFRYFWLTWLAVGSATPFDRIEINASLDHRSRLISGVVRVRFESIDTPLDNIRFRLYPNWLCQDSATEDCGIVVSSILIDGREAREHMATDGTDLTVALQESYPASSTLAAELRFATHIPEQEGRFGFHDGQFTLEGWYPAPAPWRDTGWLKVDYTTHVEPVADMYDIDATVWLSDSLQVIAPGIQKIDKVDNGQTVRLSLHPAQDLPLVVATRYARHDTVCHGVTVKTYYRPERVFVRDTVCQTVCRTLEYMADHVTPYPFDELIVVVGGLKRSGAVEWPRMVLMSDRVSGFFSRIYQITMIHEVVHQWFYGILNSDQASEPWLDEAVTEYFTERINRWMVGGEGDFLSLYGLTANYAGVQRTLSHPVLDLLPIDRPAVSYSHGEYFTTVYNKGALVLRTMVGIMGREKEERFWQEYVRRFRFARPARQNFIATATEYMPTEDTGTVSALLSTVTAPDFAIRSVAVDFASDKEAEAPSPPADKRKPLKITVEYVARQPLGFPVDLRIDYRDGSVLDTILDPIPGAHRLTFHHEAVPASVIIDPEHKYALDRNLMNNSYRLAGGRGSGLRTFSGVLFLVESFFSTLWGI